MAAASPRILLISNVERGQCNVFLATARAILHADPNVDLHFASFPALEAEIQSISDDAKRTNASTKPISWHSIAGQTHGEAVSAAIAKLYPGEDEEKTLFKTPNLARPLSTLMSGISFPIPWHRVPLNIFFYFYTLRTIATDRGLRGVLQHVTKALGRPARTVRDVINSKGPGTPTVFVNTLPELDFPWLPCPPHVIASGPIVRRVQPISEADPELADWLSGSPTIFINLGTHTKLTEAKAAEFATALNMSLNTMDDRHPSSRPLQILWKLQKAGEYDATASGSRIYSILKDKIESNRMRITSWLTAEPLAILQTGNIACFIHHGGANSYNEAVLNGVPHVVLPSWTDCYEYAQRVEYHGIGRIGARKQVPQVEASELSRELLTVLDGEETKSIKRKAQELAAICKEKGDGADAVAYKMLELAKKS
ncbi:diacylglycerol o-acyltransferase [Arthroderma uncinatum]|uniref:diacylglycerol o-acyltransferase n=1 Tax=Arthroderma uncinatum TaxID=74035 RepID=UPI00144A7718|nr:diacylglycerol o-acyltransferase [Arthroderma uncinatum]KAF3484013.1 diacylglycerol o-acyltransferase [Arthroderma uncinatum]